MEQTSILSIRRIVITGTLASIAIVLGITGWGFIPVPNVTGNATIMHVPAILGGVLEGPVVGGMIGFIFGAFSFLRATNPIFKNPLVAIFPRIWIGVVAYYAYVLGRRMYGESLGLILAGVFGTLTNTVLVLSLAVFTKLLAPELIPTIIPQAIAEVIVATIVTVVVVRAWKGVEQEHKAEEVEVVGRLTYIALLPALRVGFAMLAFIYTLVGAVGILAFISGSTQVAEAIGLTLIGSSFGEILVGYVMGIFLWGAAGGVGLTVIAAVYNLVSRWVGTIEFHVERESEW